MKWTRNTPSKILYEAMPNHHIFVASSLQQKQWSFSKTPIAKLLSCMFSHLFFYKKSGNLSGGALSGFNIAILLKWRWSFFYIYAKLHVGLNSCSGSIQTKISFSSQQSFFLHSHLICCIYYILCYLTCGDVLEILEMDHE